MSRHEWEDAAYPHLKPCADEEEFWYLWGAETREGRDAQVAEDILRKEVEHAPILPDPP